MAGKRTTAPKRPRGQSNRKKKAPKLPPLQRGERFVEAFPLVEGSPVPIWARIKPKPRPKSGNLGILPRGAINLRPHPPTGEPVLRSIRHPASAGTFFLLVGEGFPDTDPQRFFDRAESVAVALLAKEPFQSLSEKIAIHALFLPLAGTAVVDIECDRSEANLARLRPTLFATQCCVDGSTSHLWCGDEDVVRRVVGAALAPQRAIGSYKFLAVLIDSESYGGAGSIPNSTATPRIAWATTDNRHSMMILLHELGHAFGLQDEYEQEQVDPVKPWRNISQFGRPDATPWHRLVNAPDRASVTCPTADAPWTGDKGIIGTFEGAGYDSEGRYRPMVKCRMRDLADEFCVICSDHIRSEIDPTHDGKVGEEN